MTELMIRQNKLMDLMQKDYRYWSVDDFDNHAKKAGILSEMPDYDSYLKAKKKAKKEQDKAVPEFRHLYEEPLLTKDQEQHLFKKMNFFKYKANKLLKKCDIFKPRKFIISMIEKLLGQANTIRQQVACCNMRLVVNIAKKQYEYVQNKGSLDRFTEIVSDGNLGVISAVDYFDFRIGTKFSTYAYWVIMDKFNRGRQYRSKHDVVNHGDNLLEQQVDVRNISREYEKELETDKDRLTDLLSKIDGRLREIIVRSYHIGGHSKTTLEEIGKDFNVSKERIRQLRNVGIDKLRKLAGC